MFVFQSNKCWRSRLPVNPVDAGKRIIRLMIYFATWCATDAEANLPLTLAQLMAYIHHAPVDMTAKLITHTVYYLHVISGVVETILSLSYLSLP